MAKGTIWDPRNASDTRYLSDFNGRSGQSNMGTMGIGMSGCQNQSRFRLPEVETVTVSSTRKSRSGNGNHTRRASAILLCVRAS